MIWATNRTLCAAEPRRKEQWHHKRLTLWVSRSLWRAWVGGGLLQALNAAVWQLCMGPFEGGAIILITSTSLVSGQTTGREHSPTHQQKIGLKIYWAWPHPSEQDPVSLTISLYHQEASISLLIVSFRGQTEWKWQSQKTNQTDCLTFCDPLDCSPPGSSVHGILQARILEWVAISFSRGSSRPRDLTWVFLQPPQKPNMDHSLV